MTESERICVFSSYCSSTYCDMSCVKNTISQILLDKSDIQTSNNVYKLDSTCKSSAWEIVNSSFGSFKVICKDDPSQYADILTFASICNFCVGHGSSVNVYHLKYSKYIQSIRDSWSSGVTPKLRESQAFVSNSKILIISGLDYYNLKDFECQTLLTLLQERDRANMCTIIVVHDVNSLFGSGPFFNPLKEKLKGAIVNA